MKNNPLYIQLRQIVLDGDYTLKQLDDVTKAQVESVLGVGTLPMQFVKNMKTVLIRELLIRDDDIERVAIEKKIVEHFGNRFPNLVVSIRRKKGKRIVQLLLDGEID